MREPIPMYKSHRLKQLPRDSLNLTQRKTHIVIPLDDVEERGSKALEDQAVVVVVVEALEITYKMVFITRIPIAQIFDDCALCFGRVNVFLHWFYHLTCRKVTFIAYYLPS